MADTAGNRNPGYAHSWTELVAADTFQHQYLGIVTAFLDGKYSGYVQELADCTDAKGRTAFRIADPEVRREFQKRLYYLGRYILQCPPVHKSKTCAVHFATDCLDGSRPVADFENGDRLISSTPMIKFDNASDGIFYIVG